MSILILVAPENGAEISPAHLEKIAGLISISTPHWLAEKEAVELPLSYPLTPKHRQQLADFLAKDGIDFFCIPKKTQRRKKLLLCDMDSTVVEGETLDNLAASVGLKKEITAITNRAMAGELDFRSALRERVALLRGMPESAVAAELTKIRYTKGAWELVQTMTAAGARCVLVSGGFTCFSDVVAEKLGFHHHHGNTLLFEKGVATGKVSEPILNRNAKKEMLTRYAQKYHLQKEDILAVGDGANDLEMLLAAGLGVGFHPKEFLQKQVENSIVYGSLKALLYLQGFSQAEIIENCATRK